MSAKLSKRNLIRISIMRYRAIIIPNWLSKNVIIYTLYDFYFRPTDFSIDSNSAITFSGSRWGLRWVMSAFL